MWMLGILAYYLFHRVAIVYYLGIYAKGSMQRPVASMYRWFHQTMYAVSALLFAASCIFFYLSDPWLTATPVLLLGVSWISMRVKYGRQMDRIINGATEIQVRMEREGRPQTEINKAIYLGATGRIYPIDSDLDLKSFLRCCVLSEVIGFDASEDLMRSIQKAEDRKAGDPKYLSVSDKIDAAVDQFYQHWCKLYDGMQKLRR